MKKLLVSLAGAALLLAACTPQELSNQALKDRLDQHDKDIAALQGDVNELKTAVSQINSNIAALQTAVTKLEGNVYVKDVIQIKDVESNVIGYTIKFTDNTSIAIYHGEKGEQGQQGEIGPQGPQGATPTIGVKLYDGVYYWTLNDEYMTDEKGKMIPATGEKGNPGQDGNNGQTPQLRIEAGNWEVSYDGQTWTVVGPAQTAAESVDVVFKGVKETKDAVVFTLSDDSKLSIDKYVDFSLKVDASSSIDVVEGTTTEVAYTLVGVGKGESRVDAVASGDWWAEVVPANNEGGVVLVTAGKVKNAKVLLYAVDGKGRADMHSLIFEGGSLIATVPVEDSPVAGGEVVVPVVTNVDYTVEIEESARYWLSYAITKAGDVRNEKLILTVEMNTMPETRTGKVDLKDGNGAVIQSFTVKQESGVYTEPVFEDEKFGKWILSTYDTNKDEHLSAEEASKITSLTPPQYDSNWNTMNFTSLKGVECFYNLKSITLTEYSGAKLSSLDLSKNKQLETVNISKSYYATSALASLDLSDLHVLKSVQVGGVTALTSLELGNAPMLTGLYAFNTALTTIDVTGAPELTEIAVYGTKIASLDLSKNTKLLSANVGASTLTALTLPDEPVITSLNIDNTPLTSMDLSKFTELTSFSAAATKLETIDLSNSSKLTSFSVGSYGTGTSNYLKKVDIRKATKLSSCSLYSSVLEEVIIPKGLSTSSWNWNSYHQNPDTGAFVYVKVTEIEVEGGDEPASDDFAEGIKEPFVKKVILGKFDKDGDGAISAVEAEAVTELDLSECGLEDGDLAGLEVFPIKKFLLNGNKLSAFDILAWPTLEWLNLNNNKITALSIGTAALKQNLHLEAANNQITKVTGPSYGAKLSYVDLSNNKLSGSFNLVYYSTVPTYVNVSGNAITSINLAGCSGILELNVSNNKLTTLSSTALSKVKKIDASHNSLSSFSFGTTQYSLEELNLGYNQFKSLDISTVAKNASNFALKKIDLTGNEGFNLIVVGSGNKMPEGLEIVADGEYGVLNAANPTKELVYNKSSYIKSVVLGEGATEFNSVINFGAEQKVFEVPAGSTIKIVSNGNRKTLRVYALGVGGTPTVAVSRADGKKVYNKTDNNYCSVNPYTTRKNDSTDKAKLVIDGDGDSILYFFGPTTGDSSGGLVDGDTVILTVGGNTGESVIFVGLNLETYTTDDYGWM